MKKFFVILGGLLFLFIQCKDDKSPVSHTSYDPDKPLELISFSPDSGGLAEQIILRGSNFGANSEDLRVYFNTKRASVIKTIGNLAYVVAPRLPGDTCTISVVIGKDSMQYKNNFYYKTKVQVSTISGTPFRDEGHEDGTLVEAVFSRPYYITVDKEKNIFIGQYPNGTTGSMHRIRMLNEEKNTVTTIYQVSGGGYILSGTCSPTTQTIYFPLDGSLQYIELDPEKQWASHKITPRLKAGETFDLNNLENKYCFAVSPEDNMIYTITTKGELVRIHPKTHEVELVMSGILTNVLDGIIQVYLTFDPKNSNMLYLANPSSLNPADGVIPGTDKIYRIDLRRKLIETYAGSGVKGHLDGPSNLAQFNNPCQICFNNDGTLYVGDTDNYCVRKISPDGIVSTVVGVPGEKGYLDGDPEVALFDRFWGMYIDEDGSLYIADYYNKCVRKLTIE